MGVDPSSGSMSQMDPTINSLQGSMISGSNGKMEMRIHDTYGSHDKMSTSVSKCTITNKMLLQCLQLCIMFSSIEHDCFIPLKPMSPIDLLTKMMLASMVPLDLDKIHAQIYDPRRSRQNAWVECMMSYDPGSRSLGSDLGSRFWDPAPCLVYVLLYGFWDPPYMSGILVIRLFWFS